MRYDREAMELQAAMQTAARMCAAARTAPKGHGKDTLHTYVLTGDDKEALARKMEEVGLREMGDEMPTWYGRDAACVRKSLAVVLIGADKKQRGVPTVATAATETATAAARPAATAPLPMWTLASPFPPP